MANRRVYEIARDRGLTTSELLQRLERDGIHDKRALSTIDEELVDAALPAGHRPIAPASPVAILAAIALITAAWFVGGSTFGGDTGANSASSGDGTRDLGPQQPAASRGPQYKSIVATVTSSKIQVYSEPRSDKKSQLLDSPNLDGAKVVFLVKSIKGPWLHVYLPTRPNGSTGWIKKKTVKLAGHSYRVLINLDKHILKAWDGNKKILRTQIGVGRAVTPTPVGLYYITELLKQPDPNGTYGPYAFGLSAHSDVLNEFAGRDGVLGIHGTNFPQGIGTNVSHGCIRLHNKAIIKLAHTLPVGTPVRIRRI